MEDELSQSNLLVKSTLSSYYEVIVHTKQATSGDP